MGQCELYELLKSQPKVWFSRDELKVYFPINLSLINKGMLKLERFGFVEVRLRPHEFCNEKRKNYRIKEWRFKK